MALRLPLLVCLLALSGEVFAQDGISFPGDVRVRDPPKVHRPTPLKDPNSKAKLDPKLNELQTDVLYLLERSNEPMAIPKGPNFTVVFDLPNELVPDSIDVNVATRLGVGPVHLVNVQPTSQASLGAALTVDRNVVFSRFIRSHRRAAADLIAYLMSAKDSKDLVALAALARDRVNEQMFVYALSFVLTHREDFEGVQIPAMAEILPQNFISEETLHEAEEQVNRRPFMARPPDRVVVDHGLEFTGTNLNPENRVAYWREDYGVNSHHWHWHLVNPIENPEYQRDRKGELFYYFHQQMLARYDHERLSNDLQRVKPLSDWRKPVEEGYFSKLTVQNAGRQYGDRPNHMTLSDIRRGDSPFESFDIATLELYRDRLFMAVHQGWLVDRAGDRIFLNDSIVSPTRTNKRGIDLIGDTFEADALQSVNYQFYGDLHNLMHLLVGFIHDPDGSHRAQPNVMATSQTAMRDPVFYRVHKFVDNLMDEYKKTQAPYTDEELELPNIVMEDISVVTSGGSPNTIYTGWDTREVEASRGLGFSQRLPVIVRLKHLQHRDFVTRFTMLNRGTTAKLVTARVFLAPTHNERGAQFGEMTYADQRRLWAELDKFVVRISPGRNIVERRSRDSSLIIPEERTFRDLEQGRTAEPGLDEEGDFTRCGFPQHVLIPKGKTGGMQYQIFVVLSDWQKDRASPNQIPHFSRGSSFCGVMRNLFPDRRPMGFPFDRLQPQRRTPIISSTDFANAFPNMAIQDISIDFQGDQLGK